MTNNIPTLAATSATTTTSPTNSESSMMMQPAGACFGAPANLVVHMSKNVVPSMITQADDDPHHSSLNNTNQDLSNHHEESLNSHEDSNPIMNEDPMFSKFVFPPVNKTRTIQDSDPMMESNSLSHHFHEQQQHSHTQLQSSPHEKHVTSTIAKRRRKSVISVVPHQITFPHHHPISGSAVSHSLRKHSISSTEYHNLMSSLNQKKSPISQQHTSSTTSTTSTASSKSPTLTTSYSSHNSNHPHHNEDDVFGIREQMMKMDQSTNASIIDENTIMSMDEDENDYYPYRHGFNHPTFSFKKAMQHGPSSSSPMLHFHKNVLNVENISKMDQNSNSSSSSLSKRRLSFVDIDLESLFKQKIQ
ncbi:hypothetical protein C9374_008166 [Naegleria lovaniensis]|uniref:Uncharacterized protein n=1 Tax=Naegleria lovaniensis TaxID=51637 RepID=A0AA88GJJ1_NAELO|nr:uncharacterized protein C9374_008166 [Naegleria lovaniensis]KAG2378527.1 hypothetical protein C9374_008166 [Naegleria lovaniensis]